MKHVRMTAAGDCILDLGFEKGGYAGFSAVRDELGRGEAIFGNLETTVTSYDVYPSAYCGGLWLQAPVSTLKQIASYGFNFFGFANNHTMDFGADGLLETVENVKTHTEAVITGAGKDLYEASAPVFRDFPGGRVAFLALSSSFTDAARAGYASRTLPGRPGLNPLRYQQYCTVTSEHFEALRQIASATKLNGQRDRSRQNGFLPPLPDGTLDFGGVYFRLSENGKEEKINHPHPDDLKRTLDSIRDARRMADYVAVMVHSHQIMADEMCYPDHFVREFAHACIDAGADVILGGGTHEFKPVEMYKGKPIFHSLGNFIFQLNTIRRQADDMRFEDHFFAESDVDVLANRFNNWKKGLWVQKQNFLGIVPYLEFEGDSLKRLEIRPLDLGFAAPQHKKGLPVLADRALAEEICDRFNELSKNYGAAFKLKDGVMILS